MRLADKSAIVTGAASGIGLAIATRLGTEGARVVIADLVGANAQAAAQAVRKAGAPDTAVSAGDVSDEVAVAQCCRLALARFGRLDIIVNNAGLIMFKPLEAFTSADWLKVLSVDLLGAVHFTREAFAHMTNGGSIVNISSVHALETTPHVAPYAAAKAALLSLTRSTAIEGRARGIRANAILPGAIDTPMLWENPNIKSGVETISPEDVGKPEQIAAAAAFLASDDAAFVNGAALNVDGGRLARL
ncbi:SDR family oxidoreductase [Mesorhizobium sp. CO1-1-7]|uniref:SDR family NAD(P)-dependent oxidoreductase n=1 Tax=unclassified Mesorhizobium TaxID=325217 RepID=UPI00112DDDDE|nr:MULTISPECIES: SDR family oxidoreductase [unclassified Mesorhizobium]MBZ9929598.1 SDR family oxidoreductase [Mesorhizobium sp. BR1-1-5]MBZ9747775.1 SDR family oxidoreductase [Mesorhizobium sp. CO1-1-7]MBZ9905452.1 SDR family oxidoreductase [Mesorhizobium sp. BR115XR7A]TPL74265.1 SDR family oxidoreductase [Mesorhizobium sp. B2-3-15]TPL99582.1 SDR family oxidoreductase [Mesorhizobium sp. B2-3-10]